MPSSPDPDPRLWISILAGGIGSRFWPASTPSRPKPLLPLGSSRPLILDTVDRARALVPGDRLRILTGAHLVGPFRRAVPSLTEESFWIEPSARGTAPVLAWAAHRIHRLQPDATLVSLHADHLVDPEAAFPPVIEAAVALARREDLLLTITAVPDRPETGYGYVRPGEPLAAGEDVEAYRVGAFVEKPDAATAEAYVADGYLWNTGIFVLPVSRFLDEVREHAPEIGGQLAHLDRGDDEAFFGAVPTISVDEAIFERSRRVGAVTADFRWDDVGSWEALTRSLEGDEAGNRAVGSAHLVDAHDSVVWAEDGPVAVFGVRGLVVVRSGGVTLVTSRERAPDLKELVARLPRELREGTRQDAADSRTEGEPNPATGSRE